MGRVKFAPEVVTVCSEKEEGFDCKNNPECSKSANFRLGNICKINCRTLIVLSYISSGLKSNKVQLVQKFFK